MKTRIYGKVVNLCYQDLYDKYECVEDLYYNLTFSLCFLKSNEEKIEFYQKVIKSQSNNLEKIKNISREEYIKSLLCYLCFNNWKLKKEIEFPYKLSTQEYFEGFKIEKVNYLENQIVEYYTEEVLEEVDISDNEKVKLYNSYKNKANDKFIPDIELLIERLNKDLHKLRNKKSIFTFVKFK